MHDFIIITISFLISSFYHRVIRPRIKDLGYGHRWKCPECDFSLKANVDLPYFKIIEDQHIKSHTDRNFKE